jgi:acetyl esterase/lipase
MRRAPAAIRAAVCAAALAACATAGHKDVYTAETTYAKLAPRFPFIRIASRAVPPDVRAVKNLTYVRHGGRALQLDLYLPSAQANQPLPAIVFVHGGAWRTGVRDNFAPMAIRMAQRGYAAATISYRLAPEDRYPAAIHDVNAAVRWVRAHAGDYGVDAGRIAVAGGSASPTAMRASIRMRRPARPPRAWRRSSTSTAYPISRPTKRAGTRTIL